MDSDTDIVFLASAQSEVEGIMLADNLRAAGIQVLLRPGGPGAGAWASAATFEHDLLVHRDDLERARLLLNRERGPDVSELRDRPLPRLNRRVRHR